MTGMTGECEICHTVSGDAVRCPKCQTILCQTCVKGHDCKGKVKPRPPCPECGAENPASKGYRWRCKKCGREYLKEYRGPYKNRNDGALDLNTAPQIDVSKVKDI